MSITTFTSREFNQSPNKVKNAAQNGAVFITERGTVSHVLLTLEEYNKIHTDERSIVDMLTMHDGSEIDFEPPKLSKALFHRDEL
ncbi:type II toxin-antitoxin system Phd/YefM family antitoxin [Fangia hongkongensis]|uniref:type II toxin-antitoxin system Phd/YefM family antitoxin n=1 Tax=Fangia hongkongensis TaxID=270495 RepID=UPI0003829184|nr:hypothetical protein [Fangia hongkongensis]MBK2124530.1 type II toxin-antitoxin system Phd/YefM family antitoxin [Fangia hongkongensis]